MAVQKKKTSMLQQSASESAKAEQEARIKMKEDMQGGEASPSTPVVKTKTKGQRIKDLRPLQVSVHFTQDEKYGMEDARTLARRLGIGDATVEDFIHGLVQSGLKSIKDNPDLLVRIMKEEDVYIS